MTQSLLINMPCLKNAILGDRLLIKLEPVASSNPTRF